MEQSIFDKYLRVRQSESKVYEWLGVRIYKKIVPTSGDLICRLLGLRLIQGHSAKDLRDYRDSNIVCEAIHLFLFLLYLLMALIIGQWLLWTIANLLVNIYPIMTQRYLRFRVDAILVKRAG